jgi:hypothetical protein
MNILFFLLFILFYEAHSDPIHFPEEKHLRNVRQLTFGGSNLRAQFRFFAVFIFKANFILCLVQMGDI